jgi:uncharacterized membrane protein
MKLSINVKNLTTNTNRVFLMEENDSKIVRWASITLPLEGVIRFLLLAATAYLVIRSFQTGWLLSSKYVQGSLLMTVGWWIENMRIKSKSNSIMKTLHKYVDFEKEAVVSVEMK